MKTKTATFFICLLLLQPALAETFMAKVVGVTDGDTVTVLREECSAEGTCKKSQHRIRLVEIDTPESRQPWGSRAKQALSDMVFSKTVRVETTGTDQYRRILAHLYVQDLWVNAELVRNGHAWVYRRYAKSPELYEFEKQARSSNKGLWGLPEAQRVPPWDWRRK